MSTIHSVGIVGLGLIGGSLARDLAARGVRVHACDTDTGALRAAMEDGVVHAAFDGSLQSVGNVDALVLAVPLTAAIDILQRASAHLSQVPLITDVCSTKRTLAGVAAGVGLADRFIGAHPLAGDHRSGWHASRADLFQGATVYVCPTDSARSDALTSLLELWQSRGAIPEIIDPAEHDWLLGWTSHLPQTVATALARAIANAGITLDRLGPGGRDMTRLAASSPDIWTPTALDNAAALCEGLAALEADLARFREALARRDHGAVRSFFERKGTLDPTNAVPVQ